jgi:hypothetical protein
MLAPHANGSNDKTRSFSAISNNQVGTPSLSSNEIPVVFAGCTDLIPRAGLLCCGLSTIRLLARPTNQLLRGKHPLHAECCSVSAC